MQYKWVNQKKSRYYKIIIHRDMLNDLILTCIWGSSKNNLGNFSHTLINNIDEANQFINQMKSIRSKRGYQLI